MNACQFNFGPNADVVEEVAKDDDVGVAEVIAETVRVLGLKESVAAMEVEVRVEPWAGFGSQETDPPTLKPTLTLTPKHRLQRIVFGSST